VIEQAYRGRFVGMCDLMVRCLLHNSSSGLVEGACKGMAPGRGFSPTYGNAWGDYLRGGDCA